MKQKCSNKAECDNVIPLKVTNQTDPRIKKNGDIDSIYIYYFKGLFTVPYCSIILTDVLNFNFS